MGDLICLEEARFSNPSSQRGIFILICIDTVEPHTMNYEHYFLPSKFQFPSLFSMFSPIIIKQEDAYFGGGVR